MMAVALWLSILLSIAHTGPVPGASPQSSIPVPRFERSVCPVETVPDEAIDCGVYAALHGRQMIPHIPRIISSAANRDYKELTPLVSSNQGGSSTAWGLRCSVWCADEAPFERANRIAAQVSPDLGLGGIDEGTASPGECIAWNAAPAPAIENEPVKSDVPALIFAGEFDPDTPPDWGRQLLETMPDAVYLELRGGTHGAGFSSCGGEITMAFFRAPGSPLPVDCALKYAGRTSVSAPGCSTNGRNACALLAPGTQVVSEFGSSRASKRA